jgi:hypothetical protein
MEEGLGVDAHYPGQLVEEIVEARDRRDKGPGVGIVKMQDEFTEEFDGDIDPCEGEQSKTKITKRGR